MSYSTCTFGEITIFVDWGVRHYEFCPPKPYFPGWDSWGFSLVTTDTFVHQLTKFQLYTILFRVHAIFSLKRLD